MYHQRLEAFCATDPTSISTTQSPKSFGKDLHPKSNTSRTPPTFKSAVATMEVQQKEYILSVSGRPLLPFPTTPCPSVDVLRFSVLWWLVLFVTHYDRYKWIVGLVWGSTLPLPPIWTLYILPWLWGLLPQYINTPFVSLFVFWTLSPKELMFTDRYQTIFCEHWIDFLT